MSSGKEKKKSKTAKDRWEVGVPRSRSKPPVKVARKDGDPGARDAAQPQPLAATAVGGVGGGSTRAAHTSAVGLYDPSMEPTQPTRNDGSPGPWRDGAEAPTAKAPPPLPPAPPPAPPPRYKYSGTYAADLSPDPPPSDSDDDGGDPKEKRDFVTWVTNAVDDYGQSQDILFSQYKEMPSSTQ